MALGAAGLVMCEMTNVNPQGRISPKCAGMWSDDNEAALKRVHDFCRQYGVAKLTAAIEDALARGVPHPNAVRLALDRHPEPPPVAVVLPEHVKHRDVPVRPHALADYDALLETDHE